MTNRASPDQLVGHPILSQSNNDSITRFHHAQEIENPSSVPNLAGEEEVETPTVDQAMLYSPDYFAYYYSQRPYADARLPVPLLTWEQYSYIRGQGGYPQSPKEGGLAGSDGELSDNGDSPQWRSASSPTSLVDKIQSDFPSTPSNVLASSSPIVPITNPTTKKSSLPSEKPRVNSSNQYPTTLPYQNPALGGPSSLLGGGLGSLHSSNGIQLNQQQANGVMYNQMQSYLPPPFPEDSLVSRMERVSLQDQQQGKSKRGRHDQQGEGSPQQYLSQGSPYFSQPGSGFGQLYSPHGGMPLGVNNMSPLIGSNSPQYLYQNSRSLEQQMSMSPPPMYGNPFVYGVDPSQQQQQQNYSSGKVVNNQRAFGVSSSSGSGSKRSSLLEEFRKKNNKKFELKDVVGHFVEFSGDQHGSRFIQQKLETSSASEKQLVFKEIYPQCIPLMTDVFGNYVIQKFFEHGTVEHKRLLGESLVGNVLTLSLQMYGCRVIQKALEVISPEQQSILVKELEGNVLKCIKDQNGNHVIQKVIETVPEHCTQFIVDTFSNKVYQLATHPYGCRVIQRILEHHSDQNTFERRFEVSGPPPYIVKELLHYGINLVQDQYGNYVIQHLLVHGKQSDRIEIARQVRGKILQFSQHKFASNVIEKCVQYGDDDQRKWLIEEICADPNGLETMMKDQYANYVVQKILDVCDADQREHLINQIRPHIASLKKYTYGKHIIARLEKLIGKSIT